MDMLSEAVFLVDFRLIRRISTEGFKPDPLIRVMEERQRTFVLVYIGILVSLISAIELRSVDRLPVGPSPFFDEASHAIEEKQSQLCHPLSHRELRQVLGSAYNEYYTSVTPPPYSSVLDGGLFAGQEALYKRSGGKSENINSSFASLPFSFGSDYQKVLSEEPAWRVQAVVSEPFIETIERVPRRATANIHTSKWQQPESMETVIDAVIDTVARLGGREFKWDCEAPLLWKDLGRNYFPRYILSKDCSHKRCQGARFRCESRSFAIKVLRRRNKLCAPGFKAEKDILDIGDDLMPKSLRELWVWEMRSVDFCCVCSIR